jgi:uncharacterized protein YjdB
MPLLPSSRVLMLSLALLASACSSSPARLTLQPPAAGTLRVRGERVRLEYVVEDRKGRRVADPEVRWASTAPEVATVEAGVLVAGRSGTATIIAVSGSARTALPVVVDIPVSIDLRTDGVDFLEAGRSLPVAVVVKNDLGKAIRSAEVAWSSSDEEVARVEGGRIVGLSPGQARLTATLGAVRRSLDVRVVRNDLARLGLSHTRLQLQRTGQSARLKAQAFNAKGTFIDGVPVTWYSSDWSVATVSHDGVVTAVGKGRTVVTAMAGRRKAAAEVAVE